jgi:PAS domain S-box-containing protein
MITKVKKFTGYIALAIVFLLILIAFLFATMSELTLTLLGVAVAIAATLTWSAEGGLIVMFLLGSVVLSMFFKSTEIMLFGISAAVITTAITFQLRSAVKDLRKSERKYRSITNNVSGAVYSQAIDKKPQVTFISDQFEKVTGHNPKKFLSGEKEIHDMVHPGDWARVKMVIDDKIKNKESWDIEYRIVGSDEEVRWVNERGGMVLGSEGEFFLEAIIIDITSKKLTKDALVESEEKYRNLVELANDGIMIVKDGKIKYLNSRISDMLELSKDEIIGTVFEDYIDQKEKSKFVTGYREGSDDKSFVIETVLRNSKGRKISIEISSGVINYEGDLADLLIIRDITQRKQIEEIVHQREQEFRNLVERAPDIIARFDPGHRYIYINPIIEKESGIQPKDFFWKTPREAGFSENTSRVWEEALDDVFETGKEKAIYTEQMTLSGKRYHYTRLLPEFSKDGEIRTVLAISRDITEAKEIDKVKSEFISVLSHQLRTPLSVIRWCAVMFLDGMLGKLNDEQIGYLEKIYESTKKLIKISNTLFNAAILDLGILTVIPKRLDIVKVLKESLTDIEPDRVAKEIKISVSHEKDLSKVKVDKRLLKTIFRGLLSNAVKYGYQGGNVWIDIKREDGSILVKIADDGRGIPIREQSRIFTKFFRAENVKNEELYGTGLDLYIIKEIVNNFGGIIWFESPNPDIGKKEKPGTAFYFTIPLTGMKKHHGEKGLTDQSL